MFLQHGAAPDADEEPPPAKKAKESASELCSSGRLFWSKVRGIANRFNSPLDAIGIEGMWPVAAGHATLYT